MWRHHDHDRHTLERFQILIPESRLSMDEDLRDFSDSGERISNLTQLLTIITSSTPFYGTMTFGSVDC